MSKGESTKAILRSKKTAKKAVTKVSAKKNTSPKPGVLTAGTQKPVKKLSTVKALKKKTTVISKKSTATVPDNAAQKPKSDLALPASRGLMVLSPLRFPLDIDKIAVQTATYAGAFLVVIGAILTMWHSTLVFSTAAPMSFVAQLIMNDYSPIILEPTTTTTTPEPVEQKFVNTTVAFKFEPAKPIHGDSVLVQVTLPGETYEAYLYARDTKTGATIDFGAFDSFSGLTAETYIDVTDVSDGTYRFYVVATYESQQNGYYTVTITDTNRQEIYLQPEENVITEDVTETATEAVDETDDAEAEIEDNFETEIAAADELESLAEETKELKVVSEPVDVTNPEITIVLPGAKLTGKSNLSVNVLGATYLEVYALQENTGTQRYIGLPKQFNDRTWQLAIDTTHLPNGLYTFVVNVRTKYGFFTKRSAIVSVYNETETITDAAALDYQANALSLTEQALKDVFIFGSEPKTPLTPEEQLNQLVAQGTTTDLDSTVPAISAHEAEFSALVAEHRLAIEKAMQTLAAAYRSGDTNQINQATERIAALIESFNIESLDVLKYTKEQIEKLSLRVTADVETTNKIIAERTGVTAETDTDRDGITDFDEIVIYKTNPQVADSDGDGFTDGAEVLSGFDPTDSTPQAPIAYESPQEGGIIRDDLLSVDTIATESIGEVETDSPVALLTGKGLPNSFVTLYIFSTPIVVTVRTDSEGSWIYRFDKELEDGEHQVYAGITDNAGKIVAKSNPLTFVKTAQAYELLESPAPGTISGSEPDNTETHSMISLILVTASISVVAIGLVLILLGVHLDGRKRREVIKTAESV